MIYINVKEKQMTVEMPENDEVFVAEIVGLIIGLVSNEKTYTLFKKAMNVLNNKDDTEFEFKFIDKSKS